MKKKRKTKQPKIECFNCFKRVLEVDTCKATTVDFVSGPVCFDCFELLVQRRTSLTAARLLKECMAYKLDWDLKDRIAFHLDTNGDYL